MQNSGNTYEFSVICGNITYDFKRFEADCTGNPSYKGRFIFGYFGFKKSWQTSSSYMLCSCLYQNIRNNILAPVLLKVSVLEAAVMGSVVVAVSPTVVVPRMIRLIDEGYGTNKSIPQLILTSASVDDVFDIVVFSFCFWKTKQIGRNHSDFRFTCYYEYDILIIAPFGAIMDK